MDENSKSGRFSEGQKPLNDEPILDLTEEISESAPDIEEAGYDDEDHFTTGTKSEESYDEFGGVHDEDDFVTSLGMEIDTHNEENDVAETKAAAPPPLDAGLNEKFEISPEQLDAALERVIQRMFYDRIDRILVDVIERRVKREIDRIKGILLDDTSE